MAEIDVIDKGDEEEEPEESEIAILCGNLMIVFIFKPKLLFPLDCFRREKALFHCKESAFLG